MANDLIHDLQSYRDGLEDDPSRLIADDVGPSSSGSDRRVTWNSFHTYRDNSDFTVESIDDQNLHQFAVNIHHGPWRF